MKGDVAKGISGAPVYSNSRCPDTWHRGRIYGVKNYCAVDLVLSFSMHNNNNYVYFQEGIAQMLLNYICSGLD